MAPDLPAALKRLLEHVERYNCHYERGGSVPPASSEASLVPARMYGRHRALIRRITAAEAADVVSPVWAWLVFPGFPNRNTSRPNRNLGIRNDRVSDAKVSFGCRALLFRIRGSVWDVEQVSGSSCLRVSAHERIRQVNLWHSNPGLPSSVHREGDLTNTLQRTDGGAVRQLATSDLAAPSRRSRAKLGLANQSPPH